MNGSPTSGPINRGGQRLNFRIARMQLSERQLEIEVERQNGLFLTPAAPIVVLARHAGFLRHRSAARKLPD